MGVAFAAGTSKAYQDGVDYFYRINDDTKLVGAWASKFAASLRSSCPPNVGVVGPTCEQGNLEILTHDFVHRTHMDIFRGVYYPPEFVDWWMDDWITRVYGHRMHKMQSVFVVHQTDFMGQRYTVDLKHKLLLEGSVEAGEKEIENWVAA